MRTWYINKECYLIPCDNGKLIIKSRGTPAQRIDNVQVTIDAQNNCNVSYTNFNWRRNISYYYSEYSIADYQPKDVLPEFIENIEITYRTGFLWLVKKTKSVQMVKDGLVRLNKPVTQHNVQSNDWYVEHITG